MGDAFTEVELRRLQRDEAPRRQPRVTVLVEPCPHCGHCEGWTYAITNTKRHRSIGLEVHYAKCRACGGRVIVRFRPLQRNTSGQIANGTDDRTP